MRQETAGNAAYGIVELGELGIVDGKIVHLAPLSQGQPIHAKRTIDVGKKWLTPALIDCHTHLIFAGNRGNEFERRLSGDSYEQIALSGGGIRATVSATRSADADSLLAGAMSRLTALLQEGVATVEIKSGYGLDHETEIRMLSVARELHRQCLPEIVNTYLGVHAIPAEFHGKVDDYIDLVVEEILPDAHEKGLVDAVDAYCESIAFDSNQISRVFDRSRELGLPVKLHADQLSDGGGAELAANFSALSADHLEYTSAAGVRALAQAGCVAVMLPGAYLTLSETQKPPIEAFRDHGVPLAIATDCNPGTSPLSSLRIAMALAARIFAITPLECLTGVTRNAAKALGLENDRGTLEVGKRADVAIWDIDHPRDLSYWMGGNEIVDLLIAGEYAVANGTVSCRPA